jgi:hypothetical protein
VRNRAAVAEVEGSQEALHHENSNADSHDAAGCGRTASAAWIPEQIVPLLKAKWVEWCGNGKRTRIMYLESKAEGLVGPARIGRVFYNKTGCTIRYGEKEFQSLKGRGFKSNYREINTGD